MGQRELQFKWDGQRDRIIFEKKKILSHRFLKEQRESVLLISGD